MAFSDTIVAIATPVGRGGIGILRLSGPSSFSIALQSMPQFKKKPRYMQYLPLLDKDNTSVLDTVCAVYFPSPYSYTGEEVVEIHLHGSPYLLQKALEDYCSLGARVAEAGEFTKRAFLNGKMNLIQAESVVDMIHASTQSSHYVALSHHQGYLYRYISKIRKKNFF